MIYIYNAKLNDLKLTILLHVRVYTVLAYRSIRTYLLRLRNKNVNKRI